MKGLYGRRVWWRDQKNEEKSGLILRAEPVRGMGPRGDEAGYLLLIFSITQSATGAGEMIEKWSWDVDTVENPFI